MRKMKKEELLSNILDFFYNFIDETLKKKRNIPLKTSKFISEWNKLLFKNNKEVILFKIDLGGESEDINFSEESEHTDDLGGKSEDINLSEESEHTEYNSETLKTSNRSNITGPNNNLPPGPNSLNITGPNNNLPPLLMLNEHPYQINKKSFGAKIF